ncbi:MAG TPA: DUF4013 domain-containing protein, partial [Thermoanaerobaculia bacterium]|nr:DUF4013 domain-containing protein [Thermoanaerobaculia bacterium]
MSEGTYTPPPYQPPPTYNPPPPQQPGGSFDFAKPFTFVFEDPNWLKKILMGGLFFIAIIFFFIGLPFCLGYYAQLTRNILEGKQYPLPEWDNLGDYFSEGLRLIGVALVWTLPVVVLCMLVVIPIAMMSATDSDAARGIGGAFVSIIYCVQFPVSLILRFVIPIALLRAIVEQRFGAGVEVGRIWAMIKGNFMNFFLAFLVSFIGGFAAAIGVIACIIGVFFTAFWSQLITAHGYA